MSAPYTPGPGTGQPGQQPQWGHPDGMVSPQAGQHGYLGQSGYQPPSYQPPSYQPPAYEQPSYQPTGYEQPSYQQPGYQQAGYQQGGYSYQPGYGSQSRESAGIAGLVTAVAGAVLLVLGVVALNWYAEGSQQAKLSDLKKDAREADIGLMKAYGSYLVWVLLIAVLLAAVLANLPLGPTATALRVIAPVLGILAAVVTLLAVNSYWSKAKDLGAADVGIFKHSAVGLYLTLAGFLVAGVAGIFGPRRT